MIVLYRGRSFVSKLIRWQTRSPYSHAGWIMKDGSVIEAWHRGGVGHNKTISAVHKPGTIVEIYDIKGLTDADKIMIECWLLDKVGKKYDFLSVLRFVSRKNKNGDNQKWFCSELVAAACQQRHINLLERIEPYQMSPALIALSPRLVHMVTRRTF